MAAGSVVVSRAQGGKPAALTRFHQRVAAEALTARSGSGSTRLAPALAHSAVDLNPHQIEAAAFALAALPTGGAVLADEVGLGKTVEAGLVLAQLAAEGKPRAVILVPATLRAQWRDELSSKFGLDADGGGRRHLPRRRAPGAPDQPLRHRRHRHRLPPLRRHARRGAGAGPLGRGGHRRGPPPPQRLPQGPPDRPGAAPGPAQVPQAPPHRHAAPERPHGAARPGRLHRRRAARHARTPSGSSTPPASSPRRRPRT